MVETRQHERQDTAGVPGSRCGGSRFPGIVASGKNRGPTPFRPRLERRDRSRRHRCARVLRRRRDQGRRHRGGGRRGREPGLAGAGRERPPRLARVRRHAQPFGRLDPHLPGRAEPRPPGHHDRGHRQLRVVVGPPRRGHGGGDPPRLEGRRDRCGLGRRGVLVRPAREIPFRRQPGAPRRAGDVARVRGRSRRSAGDGRGDAGDDAAPRGVSGPGSGRPLHRPRVHAGTVHPDRGDRGPRPDRGAAWRVLRVAHSQRGAAAPGGGGRGGANRPSGRHPRADLPREGIRPRQLGQADRLAGPHRIRAARRRRGAGRRLPLHGLLDRPDRDLPELGARRGARCDPGPAARKRARAHPPRGRRLREERRPRRLRLIVIARVHGERNRRLVGRNLAEVAERGRSIPRRRSSAWWRRKRPT